MATRRTRSRKTRRATRKTRRGTRRVTRKSRKATGRKSRKSGGRSKYVAHIKRYMKAHRGEADVTVLMKRAAKAWKKH